MDKFFPQYLWDEISRVIAIILNLYSTKSHPNYKTHEKVFIDNKSLAMKSHMFCLTTFSTNIHQITTLTNAFS